MYKSSFHQCHAAVAAAAVHVARQHSWWGAAVPPAILRLASAQGRCPRAAAAKAWAILPTEHTHRGCSIPGAMPGPRLRLALRGSVRQQPATHARRRRLLQAARDTASTRSTTIYGLLELQPGCDIAEIRKAYRKMAAQCHPDVNKSADAQQLYQVCTAGCNNSMRLHVGPAQGACQRVEQKWWGAGMP